LPPASSAVVELGSIVDDMRVACRSNASTSAHLVTAPPMASLTAMQLPKAPMVAAAVDVELTFGEATRHLAVTALQTTEIGRTRRLKTFITRLPIPSRAVSEQGLR
jgi:hypothetical protein